MRKNIYLMYAIEFFQGMVFYASIATLYRRAQGVSVFQITLIESISLALCILLEIPWGVVADKIGYRRTMVVCCGIDLLSKIVFRRAESFGGFLFERVLLSVAITGFSGVDSAIIYLSSNKGESHRAFGLLNSMGTLGLIVSSAAFSLFIKDDYKAAALFTVFSYAAAFILSFFISEVKQKQPADAHTASLVPIIRSVFKNRRLLLFLLAVGLFSQTHQTVTVFLNQLQYERSGMSNAAIGTAYIIMALLALIGAFSARITKAIGERRSFLIFCVPAAVCCAVLVLTDKAFLSVAAVLAIRACHSLFEPLQTELQNRIIKTDDRATALSVNAMFTDGIGILTNLIFGAFSKVSLPLTFSFAAILCAVSAGLLLRYVGKEKQL